MRHWNKQVIQRSSRCLVPGSVHGQLGWGPEQPGLVKGVPDFVRCLKLDGLNGSFQPKAFSGCTSQNAWSVSHVLCADSHRRLKKVKSEKYYKRHNCSSIQYEKSVNVSEILILFLN